MLIDARRSSRSIASFLLIGALLLLAASASAQPTERSSSAQVLKRGIELYGAGQTDEAQNRLRGFIIRHSTSPLLPEAYLYLARIFRDKGQFEEALLYLNRIPPERRSPEWKLIGGASMVGQGRYDQGIEMLRSLRSDTLSREDRFLQLTALAEGESETGNSLQGLLFLYQALSVADAEQREMVLQYAHVLLRDRLEDNELEEAAFMFQGSALAEDARLQRALRSFARGNRDEARLLAKEVVQSPVPFPYRRDAVLLLERLIGTTWLERSVGVVLPLSGRYAAFGTLVRRGMELAQQVHEGSGTQFVFVDSGGEPDQAVQGMIELINQHRVMTVAGPLTGAASWAAAQRAQDEGVPLISLSLRQGLPQLGSEVFRNSMTAEMQVKSLVSYVMEELGHFTFGVLSPENRLGEEMSELFIAEVESRGGIVVAMETYDEKATDFREQILRLQGKNPEAPEVEISEEGTEPFLEEEPELPFDALFIPDYADRVALISPQLAFYGLEEGVQLLGINGWNSPEHLRLAGDSVDGAIFVDGFFKESSRPVVREFVHLYQNRYGEDPSILEAQGFDVASILLTLLEDPAIQSRGDLRQALTDLEGYPGVTGTTSIRPDGESEKELFLLQVQDGEIVQIN